MKKHHWHVFWHEKLFEKHPQPHCQTRSKYNSLINSRKHMQNVRRIIELVTKNSDAMCKISPTILHGFTQVWYFNLEPNSIFGLCDLYAKLISCF
jgi:hypothetical protein